MNSQILCRMGKKGKRVFAGTYVSVLELMHQVLGVDKIVAEDKPASVQVVEYAYRHNIELIQVSRHRDMSPAWNELAAIIVCASFGRILTEQHLSSSAMTLNFHPGIIEAYRGRHPLPGAISLGHAQMGVTCHIIDSAAIDAGPIIMQIRGAIDYSVSYATNDNRLIGWADLIAEQVFSVLAETGQITATTWNSKEAEYYTPLPVDILENIVNSNNLSCFKDK